MPIHPELDTLRLELAAECLDTVATQFKRFAESRPFDEITDEDVSRFRTASETIGWIGEEYRRYAITLRATDEIAAARFRDEPAVPRDPSAFEASMSRPPPPPLPVRPVCIGSARLDRSRELLAEARDTLSRGDSQTLRAATGLTGLLLTWCGG